MPAPASTDPRAPGRWSARTGPPLAVGALAVLGTAAVHLRDPHVAGSWGGCPSLALGITCPGCGGLRAVHDLTHLDLAAAASSNLLLVAALPLLVLAWVAWLRAAHHGRPWPPRGARTSAVLAVALAVAVGFAVLRNLPAGAWLAP